MTTQTYSVEKITVDGVEWQRVDTIRPLCRRCGLEKPERLFAVYRWSGSRWIGTCFDCHQNLPAG